MSSLNLPGIEVEHPFEVDAPPPANPHVNPGVYLGNNYSQEDNPFLSNVGTYATGSPGVFAGITMLEAGFQLHQGVADTENRLINLVSGGAAMGLDILSFCTDPIGYVAGQLLSWMMEHVEPLRAMLDSLAGNPAMIKAYADSWQRVGAEMVAVVDSYKDSVAARLGEFTGQAGDAYRARAADVQNLVSAASSAADAIAKVTLTMAEVAAGVRTAVRDIMTGLAGSLVSDAILLAVPGPGTAAGIAKAIRDISAAIIEASGAVAKIGKALDDVLLLLVTIRDLSDGISKGLAVAHE